MSQMTLVDLKLAMPKNLQTFANQEFLDKVNSIAQDPDAADLIKDNFVSYISVMQDGKFKTEDYLNAVAYVSYKLMGYSNKDAWTKTFPARAQRHALLGTSDKDLSAHVAAYNKNKLVNLIVQQAMIPTYVLNQDIFQKAINVQADLMCNAQSEKVRAEAAHSLLTTLKPPEIKKVQLDVGIKHDSGIEALRATMAQLAEQQQALIKGGQMGVKQVAHMNIVDAEFAEVATVVSTPEPAPASTGAAAAPTTTAAEDAAVVEHLQQTQQKPSNLFAPRAPAPGATPPAATPATVGKSLFDTAVTPSPASEPGPGATAAQPPASAEGTAASEAAAPSKTTPLTLFPGA